jgi:KDO2-lipid IV(A) lauroyltransferase
MARFSNRSRAERTRFRHAIEYGLLRAAAFPVEWLPLPAALWVGRRLADFAFSGLRLRRRVSLENLRASLGPEVPEAELERIARAAYRNLGMTFVEFIRFGRDGVDAMRERTVVRPLAALEEAKAQGRGIVYLTAHTGNWELCGACLGALSGPVHAVVGDQKNLWVDAYVKRLRTRVRMHQIPIGSALREVLRRLGDGERMVLAADQDGGRDGLLLEFLGRPASCATGPARFAYRSRATVLVSLDRHLGGGRHEIALFPPIVPDPEQPEEDEVRRILIAFNRALGTFVQRHPDQWFWAHRRWKTGMERAAAGEAAGAD